MRGVPPVHPEFMLEPVFDNLGASRDAIGLGHRLSNTVRKYQPFSAGAELSSNGLLLRRWLRSSRGVAPKKLR